MRRSARPRSVRALVAAWGVLTAASAGCWMQGWLDYLDTSPGDAYRVEDLRILSLRPNLAGVLVDPRALYLPADDDELEAVPATSLRVGIDLFDPRGGEVTLTTYLCAGDEAVDTWGSLSLTNVQGRDLGPTVGEIVRACKRSAQSDDVGSRLEDAQARRALEVRTRTVQGPGASREDPLGSFALPDDERVVTARALRVLASQVDAGLRRFRPARLYYVAEASRTWEGQPEVVIAVLPLELRLDVNSPHLDEEERQRILESVGADRLCSGELKARCQHLLARPCASADPDEPDAGPIFCWDVPQAGCVEQCPPLPPECEGAERCVWPVDANQPFSFMGLFLGGTFDFDTYLEDAPRPGDTLIVELDGASPRNSIHLTPVLNFDDDELYQTTEEAFRLGGSEEADGGRTSGGALIPFERLTTASERGCLRLFVAGTTATLYSGTAADGYVYDGSCAASFRGTAGMELTPGRELAPGDSDVLWLVASDGRGSVVAGRFTLSYR